MAFELDHNPFLASLGITFEHWARGLAELGLTVEERHRNRLGILQGGVVATLLDAACGYAGLFSPDGEVLHAVTLSLTVNYVGRAESGRVLAVRKLTGGGRSIFFATAELRAEDGHLLATAQGTFKRRTLEGRPKPAELAGAEGSPA